MRAAGRVAEETHAELEVLDRRSARPRSASAAPRPRPPSRAREEPVRDRAERLAQPVAVREAGDADRRASRSGLHLRARTTRSHPRAACRSAIASPRALDPLELVVARRRAARARRLELLLASARGAAASRRHLAAAGMTLRFCEASIIVGETVIPSSGSTRRGQRLHRSRGPGRAPARAAAPRRSRRAGSASISGAELRLRPEPAEPLDERRRLHQRVVGDPGHRRVAAAAAHAERERRAHLLGRRAEVERPAAELEPVARRPR